MERIVEMSSVSLKRNMTTSLWYTDTSLSRSYLERYPSLLTLDYLTT